MFWLIIRIILAVLAGGVLIYLGLLALRALSQSPPDPPPPGSMRKVKLSYRCTICGTEVQTKIAPVEDPEPPRHCGEEMSIQAPIED